MFSCWKYLSRVRLTHSWEILSAREDKIRIPAQPCNILYVSLEITPFFTWFKTYTETTNDSQQLARRINSKNIVFMCCYWIKKLKFNDICVLSKNSNFCSRMLEMHVWSEAQISNFFLGGMLPDPPPPPNLWVFLHLCLTPKLLLPYLELIENPALCYRKESPRAVVKGWNQFITEIKVF